MWIVVAILEPPENQRVHVDDLVPHRLGRGRLDLLSQSVEGVEARALTAARAASKRVEQKGDARRAVVRAGVGDEGPHVGVRRSRSMLSHCAASSWARSVRPGPPRLRKSRSALTSSASVSGMRPTFRRVNSVVESRSCGASYQITRTLLNRYRRTCWRRTGGALREHRTRHECSRTPSRGGRSRY